MAVSLKVAGAQTCVIGTEHPMATMTDAGVYALEVTLPPAATYADVFEFWTVTKIGAAGDTAIASPRTAVRGRGVAVNLRPLAPIESAASITFMIRQTDGTSRSVPWAVKAAG